MVVMADCVFCTWRFYLIVNFMKQTSTKEKTGASKGEKIAHQLVFKSIASFKSCILMQKQAHLRHKGVWN